MIQKSKKSGNTNKDIFISYAKEDWDIAKRLYCDLLDLGFQPWLDTEKLLPGQIWKEAILNAIERSSYFIAIVSSKSISKKGYVQKELKIAFEILDQIPSSSIFIIPIRVDDCNPIESRLKELQWVDLFDSYENCLKKIIRVISPRNHEKLFTKVENLKETTEILSGTIKDQIQYVEITAVDRLGILADIVRLFTRANLEIVYAESETCKNNKVKVLFGLQISSKHLETFKQVDGVIKADFIAR